MILYQKGRINSLKTIETTFKQLLNDKHNIIEGTVISAVQMEEKQIKVYMLYSEVKKGEKAMDVYEILNTKYQDALKEENTRKIL